MKKEIISKRHNILTEQLCWPASQYARPVGDYQRRNGLQGQIDCDKKELAIIKNVRWWRRKGKPR